MYAFHQSGPPHDRRGLRLVNKGKDFVSVISLPGRQGPYPAQEQSPEYRLLPEPELFQERAHRLFPEQVFFL